MLRKLDVVGFLGGVYDAVGTLLERRFKLYVLIRSKSFKCFPKAHQRYYVRGLGGKPVRQLFVVRNQMRYVHVTVVLLDQDILAYLITACLRQ